MGIKNCTRCGLHKTCGHVGLQAKKQIINEVLIINKAPSRYDDENGTFFKGRSNDSLLTRLKEYGIKGALSYAVKCRPPDNRTPRKSEIEKCRYWLDKQIEDIRPKFVLLLGNTAMQSALGITGIKKKRGRPMKKNGIIYLPTYHPSSLFKNPKNNGPFMADLDLFSEIVKRGEVPKEENINHVIVNDKKTLKRFFKSLHGTVSFDIETTCLYPWDVKARITSVGFGTKKAQWTIPFCQEYSNWTKQELEKIIEKITDKLEDNCFLVAHNGKFDSLWIKVHYGVDWDIDYDTLVAHFMIDENDRHSLDYLAKKYYGAFDYDLPIEKKTSTKARDYPEIAFYHAHDLYYTRKLRFTLGKELNKEGDVKKVFQKIMMPCVNIFKDVEYNGVYINIKKMKEAEKFLKDTVKECEKELNSYLPKGTEINWASTQQLAKLLFEDFRIPVVEMTPKGKPSTSESVLKRIDHPIVSALLKYRKAKQQLSFFIEGWKPYLVGQWLHPSFKLHGTVTGRLACEHPNLQQTPQDPRIRSLITAPPGWTLVECDLSQIELRIAAELSGDTTMISAFINGIDIHWLTAIREIARGGAYPALVKNTVKKYLKTDKINYSDAIDTLIKMGPKKATEINKEWKNHRSKAKAINFGYLYGMWWKKFKIYAFDEYGVTVTDKQAEASRTAYFELYAQLEEWHNRQKRYARRNGYVKTLSGRKRRLPDATLGQDCLKRQYAERQAVNSPVQSFGNELNLMALIQLYEEFPQHKVKIVGTVHDSVLFMVKNKYIDVVVPRMLKIMQHPRLLAELDIKLRVPLEAEASIGPWSLGKDLNEWLKAA